MKYFKKIALAGASLAVAGLLVTGAFKSGETSLRKEMYGKIRKLHSISKYSLCPAFSVETEEKKILAVAWLGTLGLKIEDKKTGYSLDIDDDEVTWFGNGPLPEIGYFTGVDRAKLECSLDYGSIESCKNIKEKGKIPKNLNEIFDNALKELEPKLEEKILEREKLR